MNIKNTLLFSVFIVLSYNLTFSQTNENDSIVRYLNNTAIKLMKPHVDLTFSYLAAEIRNQEPDLKVLIPQLKDTLKYLQNLKADYSDWKDFLKIAKIYRRYGKEQSAYTYFVKAYNLISAEIKKDSLNSKYYSEMAQLYLDAGNQEYAQAYLNMAYQLNPDDVLALKLLPVYLATSGDIQKAEKINNVLLRKKPDDLEPYVNSLTIEIFKVVYDSVKYSKLESSNPLKVIDLNKIKAAQERHPKDKAFTVLYQVAKLFVLYIKYTGLLDLRSDEIKITREDQKELNTLSQFFNKAVSSAEYKNKHILYKSLGFIYMLQNDFDNSIKSFKEMMNYYPKDNLSDDYNILFAIEYYLKKDTLAAINTLKEKIDLNKSMILNNADDYVRLSNVYLQAAQYKDAKETYQLALSIYPKAKDAYLGLSVLEILNGNFQKSNEYMNKAYDIDKNYYLTYAMFGVLTLLAEEYEQAKSSLEQAVKLAPDNKTVIVLYQKFFKNQ